MIQPDIFKTLSIGKPPKTKKVKLNPRDQVVGPCNSQPIGILPNSKLRPNKEIEWVVVVDFPIKEVAGDIKEDFGVPGVLTWNEDAVVDVVEDNDSICIITMVADHFANQGEVTMVPVASELFLRAGDQLLR